MEAVIDIIARKMERQSETEEVVYFVRCGENVKIGYSNGRLKKRLAQLQTGNPTKLSLEWFVRGNRMTEWQIHFEQQHKRVNGEWYKLTNEEVWDIVKKYI